MMKWLEEYFQNVLVAGACAAFVVCAIDELIYRFKGEREET